MATFDVNKIFIPEPQDINETIISQAYNKNGNQIYKRPPDLNLISTIPVSSFVDMIVSPQGFAIYNGYYFQFFTGDNKMRIFRLSDNTLVNEYEALDIKHANVMQFGVVEEDTGFPLLYVSEWGNSGASSSSRIDVLKIGLNGYEIVDHYDLPASAGYHPNQIIDWENEIIYAIGYANNSSTSTSQPNVVTALKLSDKSIIKQFQVSYLGVANGIEFYHGNILFYGCGWAYPQVRFFVINVNTENVVEWNYPGHARGEFEDCAMYNGTLYLTSVYYDDNDEGKEKCCIHTMQL